MKRYIAIEYYHTALHYLIAFLIINLVGFFINKMRFSTEYFKFAIIFIVVTIIYDVIVCFYRNQKYKKKISKTNTN